MKSIELKAGISFKANGVTYTPSESFTIGRFEKVEELEEELIMFGEIKSCHAVMLKAMEHINQYKPGEAYMLLYNKIESDQRNAKIIHYTLRLCAAYINAEGEDIKYLSEDQITRKINDWSEEGLDVRPFLVFAATVYKELLDYYKKPIQNILTEALAIKEAMNMEMDIRTTTSSGEEK